MAILIPSWFYGFDTIMYFVCSMVGFLLSFYFHKIYSLSSNRSHLYVYLGFLLLSFGLLIQALAQVFSYSVFGVCNSSCVMGTLNNAFSLEGTYLLYYALSIAAYALFMMAYISRKFKLLPIIVFLFYLVVASMILILNETASALYYLHIFFNLVAFIMLAFVVIRNVVGYRKNKNTESLLVMTSFVLLSLFHIIHIFSVISEWTYVFAHISMLTSLILLLLMLIKVKKR